MSTDVHVECICPELDGAVRHPGGDTVTLKDKLTFRDATAIRTGLGMLYLEEPDADMTDILAVLNEGYLLHGIESWTLERDGPKGRPEPVPASRSEIRELLLANVDVAMEVGDAADTLYAGAVILPLLKRGSTSSPAMPTTPSTSPSQATSAPRRRRSKPSSISTIPTAAIERTTSSLDGASNSSQSSTSAA